MLRAAGTAVAMGQAPPEVKAQAHFVTGTRADDGCTTALDTCPERV